ncbi:50S ribosomal protein L18e [Candidatus Woesearchaeota archaeon]|nr:50S ribosomal protein L18e [Candidatus Woesearchaeota archaeon]
MTGPTNQNLVNLIHQLKKLSKEKKVNLWKTIALELEKPTRSRREVNLLHLDKHCKDNETVIIPGKVLGHGDLTKKLKVAAFRFSSSAAAKINKIGKALTIQELIKENPAGKEVRIIG